MRVAAVALAILAMTGPAMADTVQLYARRKRDRAAEPRFDPRFALRRHDESGLGDCPGLRKSVRLELTAAPFVLQFSGVAADKIAVTIGPRD
jgi:hypothetical protein